MEIRNGIETITTVDENGISHTTTRTVTPEEAKKEQYELLHTGRCSICLSKDRPVNMYNVCSDCEAGNYNDNDYRMARINLETIFSTLHSDDIDQYTAKILKAKNSETMVTSAKQFVEFCNSKGVAGKAFIAHFIKTVTKKSKYNTKVEQAYRKAFSWYTKDPL